MKTALTFAIIVGLSLGIISAYRSPATNSMLRRRSSGVARFSQHMLGHAMVEVHDLGGAELTEAEPEVHRRPHHHHDVGFLERRRASSGEREPVVGGDAAAALLAGRLREQLLEPGSQTGNRRRGGEWDTCRRC